MHALLHTHTHTQQFYGSVEFVQENHTSAWYQHSRIIRQGNNRSGLHQANNIKVASFQKFCNMLGITAEKISHVILEIYCDSNYPPNTTNSFLFLQKIFFTKIYLQVFVDAQTNQQCTTIWCILLCPLSSVSHHPKLRTAGFCCSKVRLLTCHCW